MRRRRPERAGQYEDGIYLKLTGSLAANVRALREGYGWTQEEAAERCEMATSMLQRVEAGDANLTLTTLARLCRGFAAEPQALFDTATPATKRRRGRPRATTRR